MTKKIKVKLICSCLIGTLFVVGAASCQSSSSTTKSVYEESYKNAQKNGSSGNSEKDGAQNDFDDSHVDNLTEKSNRNDVN